ncbi:MAG: hypothetical protein RBR52_03570 [Thiomonas sp.]|uniref:hypothetical protein n=1 Tax=Thiomonas sp. TaxID=2047785 RepID=UPI002A363A79|nr:hypothetical protein [Thiomonas sp.]MDY0329561.1 hypothetical protein [Thiomonas sp.]
MARQARFCSPGRAHLVRLQAASSASPLATPAQRDRFRQWMAQGLSLASVRLHGYAVLPDSALLLLTPRTAADLSRYVQGLARRSSRARTPASFASTGDSPQIGPAWAGRFQSALVQPGDWELAAMMWIDCAAERAGLSTGLSNAVAWPWSSRAAHCGEVSPTSAPPLVLTDPEAYWRLGNTPFARESVYRERLAQGLSPQQMHALEAALRSGRAAGDAAFVRQLEFESGRRLLPVPRGRPRTKVA